MTGPSLAVFVTPHGFGHAARAAAVMAELARVADARFELYAATPRWFFDESVPGRYRRHEIQADVGLVQRSALEHDVAATVDALGALLPFDRTLVDGLALEVRRAGCRAVLSDVAALGIAVAERAGLPSVLVENFTWPWIYEPLLAEAPGLARFAEELARWYARATCHVQAEPVCFPDPHATVVVPPIGRPPKRSRAVTRDGLGVGEGERMVLVTMGGVPHEIAFLDRMRDVPDVTFVVTGAPSTRRDGNVRLFDNDTRIYMPDVVRAADAVVAKLGAGTIAEVWREGRPSAWVTRPAFRESGPLEAWVRSRLAGFSMEPAEFETGAWLARVPELLATPAPPRGEGGGAERVAELLAGLLMEEGAGLRPGAGR